MVVHQQSDNILDICTLIDLGVYLKMTYFNGVKQKFDYEIRFTSDNSLACTGHSTHCFVNENHKPISIKRINPEIYNKFMSAVEE